MRFDPTPRSRQARAAKAGFGLDARSVSGEAAIPEEIVMDRILHKLGLLLVTAVLVFSIVDSAWLHH